MLDADAVRFIYIHCIYVIMLIIKEITRKMRCDRMKLIGFHSVL